MVGPDGAIVVATKIVVLMCWALTMTAVATTMWVVVGACMTTNGLPDTVETVAEPAADVLEFVFVIAAAVAAAGAGAAVAVAV